MGERVYQEEIDVAASPDDVWAVLVDVEAWPSWTASMKRVVLVTPGPLRLGSVAEVRQPRLAPTTFTVTEYDDGRSFAWSTGNKALATVGDHSVQATAEGARVTLTLRQSGPLAGAVGVLYSRLITRYVRMEAEGMKRAAESRRGAAGG